MLRDGTEVKTIPGFPNYAISRDGRVWSRPRKDTINRSVMGRWLKPGINGNGYWMVVLGVDFQRHSCPIHQLLLETYVGPRPTGMECRHLNGDKKDNNLENLAWGTRSENQRDSIRHGTHRIPHLRGEDVVTSKLTEQDVRMIIYMHRTGLFLRREIAKIYGVCRQTIDFIVNKKRWGHLWKNVAK